MPFEHYAHYHLAHQQLMQRQQHRAQQWQRRALAGGDYSLSPRVEAPYAADYAPQPVEDHRSVPNRAIGGNTSQTAAGMVTPRDMDWTPRDDPHMLNGQGSNSARAPRGMSSALMTAGLSALGSNAKSAPDTLKSPLKALSPEDLSIKELQSRPQVQQLKVRDLATDGRALGFVYPVLKGHEKQPIPDVLELPQMSESFARAAAQRNLFKITRAVI